MVKTSARLTPRGNSQAVTLPKDVLEAAGLRQGDELVLSVREDGVIELRRAGPDEAALDAGFEWSLGRYGETYRDLAK
jgi:antitoxin component of MazEF toxin-antitoxin module